MKLEVKLFIIYHMELLTYFHFIQWFILLEKDLNGIYSSLGNASSELFQRCTANWNIFVLFVKLIVREINSWTFEIIASTNRILYSFSSKHYWDYLANVINIKFKFRLFSLETHCLFNFWFPTLWMCEIAILCHPWYVRLMCILIF